MKVHIATICPEFISITKHPLSYKPFKEICMFMTKVVMIMDGPATSDWRAPLDKKEPEKRLA